MNAPTPEELHKLHTLLAGVESWIGAIVEHQVKPQLASEAYPEPSSAQRIALARGKMVEAIINMDAD